MSRPKRRILAALAVASTCCLLPVATSQAAPRGGRGETGSARVQEPGRFFLWELLTSLWQQAGVRIDNNGGS